MLVVCLKHTFDSLGVPTFLRWCSWPGCRLVDFLRRKPRGAAESKRRHSRSSTGASPFFGVCKIPFSLEYKVGSSAKIKSCRRFNVRRRSSLAAL